MSEVTVLRAEAHFSLEELAHLAAGPLAALGAERAIVFGSYARGESDGFSDLDLAIVLDTDLPRLRRGRLLGPLLAALPVGIDPVVYTPQEFKEGLRRGLGIFDAIAREGVTIYECPPD